MSVSLDGGSPPISEVIVEVQDAIDTGFSQSGEIPPELLTAWENVLSAAEKGKEA